MDNLLQTLEGSEGALGNSTFLVLGDSLLHSRLGLDESRAVLQYHRVRSLGSSQQQVRLTPVYAYKAWRTLALVRVGSYVLGMLLPLDKAFSSLATLLDEFSTSFVHSRLEIPVEVSFPLFF